MNKKSAYLLAIFVFIVMVAVIIGKFYVDKDNAQSRAYTLQERKGASAQTEEWKATREKGALLLRVLENNPTDTKSALTLAALYIKEARISGNYSYYDMAAMKYINQVLAGDSANFDALLYKALIQMSQHHFAEGLVTAEKARKINPYNAFVYGILVDGFVEMGDYNAAVEHSDKMVSIRPDLSSYSRISYLREIHGDLPGAIEAMKMAVGAGAPGDESTEWSRVQLGRLYESTGELQYAKMHYTIATDKRPGYAYALAGLARVALAEKDIRKAIQYYQEADSAIDDYSIRQELSLAYELAGERNKAQVINDEVLSGMSSESRNSQRSEELGHYSDRELAYAYIKNNQLEKALEHALLEYNRRPENIDVNETVAWVYYKRREYAKALPYMQKALKTNCKNPAMLCHAGLIFAKAGDTASAKQKLSEALKSNPNLDQDLKSECINTLNAL